MVRRVLNVVVATFGLVVSAPLMLIVTVLVRLDSSGPAIYRQERVGLCRRGSRGRPEGDRRRAQISVAPSFDGVSIVGRF